MNKYGNSEFQKGAITIFPFWKIADCQFEAFHLDFSIYNESTLNEYMDIQNSKDVLLLVQSFPGISEEGMLEKLTVFYCSRKIPCS